MTTSMPLWTPLAWSLLPWSALALFVATILLAEAMHDKPRWVLLALVGVVMGAITYELARFDHGQGVTLGLIALVLAPILMIFGTSAWAVRRFWGWPDLGDGPPRAAILAACVMAGMLLGSKQHERDIEATQQLADALGATAASDTTALPQTRLGWWDPPPVQRGHDKGKPALFFPLRGGPDAVWRVRTQGTDAWRTVQVAPTQAASK